MLVHSVIRGCGLSALEIMYHVFVQTQCFHSIRPHVLVIRLRRIGLTSLGAERDTYSINNGKDTQRKTPLNELGPSIHSELDDLDSDSGGWGSSSLRTNAGVLDGRDGWVDCW